MLKESKYFAKMIIGVSMKRLIAYTSTIFFFVITITIGLTYSYYVPKIVGNPTELTTKLSNKGIEVNYINGSDIIINST